MGKIIGETEGKLLKPFLQCSKSFESAIPDKLSFAFLFYFRIMIIFIKKINLKFHRKLERLEENILKRKMLKLYLQHQKKTPSYII